MMLFLVQHGMSLPKEVDPDRRLSEEGLAQVERMALKASELGLTVSRVIHSGKTRALQTAEAFAALLTPGRHPETVDGLNPNDDAEAFARSLSGTEDLMIVSHLPFLERFAACLVTGSTERPVVRFTNSGIVCLDYDKAVCAWSIRWAMTPEMA